MTTQPIPAHNGIRMKTTPQKIQGALLYVPSCEARWFPQVMRKRPEATHAVTAIPAPSSVLAACRLIFLPGPAAGAPGLLPGDGPLAAAAGAGTGPRAEIAAACGTTGAGNGAAARAEASSMTSAV